MMKALLSESRVAVRLAGWLFDLVLHFIFYLSDVHSILYLVEFFSFLSINEYRMLFFAMIKINEVVCLQCSKETVIYSCTTILLALSSLSVHKILFNNLD